MPILYWVLSSTFHLFFTLLEYGSYPPLKTHHCCQRCNIFQPSNHFPFLLLEKLSADLTSWTNPSLKHSFGLMSPRFPSFPFPTLQTNPSQSPFLTFLPYDLSTLKFLRLWFWLFFLSNFFLSSFIHSLGFSIIGVIIFIPDPPLSCTGLISSWTSY